MSSYGRRRGYGIVAVYTTRPLLTFTPLPAGGAVVFAEVSAHLASSWMSLLADALITMLALVAPSTSTGAGSTVPVVLLEAVVVICA